jgi:AcrR family transcriptional regulator
MLSKADKTRQYIIEKAAPLFNTKGYAATSLSDIIEITGLAKGGIYGNFSNKDEIAGECFAYSYEKVRSELAFVIRQKQTSAEKLFAILKFYRNYTIAPTIEGGCPLLNTSIEADDAYPFLKQKAQAAMKEMLGSLEKIIFYGVKYNEFRADLDPKREAEIIWALIEGGIMMSKLNDNPSTLNRILDHLRATIEKTWMK